MADTESGKSSGELGTGAPSAAPLTPLYLSADEIKQGDILPDVSRFPVARVIIDPRSHVTFRFERTEFTQTARYGGEGYGFECFYVLRVV